MRNSSLSLLCGLLLINLIACSVIVRNPGCNALLMDKANLYFMLSKIFTKIQIIFANLLIQIAILTPVNWWLLVMLISWLGSFIRYLATWIDWHCNFWSELQHFNGSTCVKCLHLVTISVKMAHAQSWFKLPNF